MPIYHYYSSREGFRACQQFFSVMAMAFYKKPVKLKIMFHPLIRHALSISILFQGSYADYMAVDEEVQQLVEHIEKLVKDNAEECGVSP